MEVCQWSKGFHQKNVFKSRFPSITRQDVSFEEPNNLDKLLCSLHIAPRIDGGDFCSTPDVPEEPANVSIKEIEKDRRKHFIQRSWSEILYGAKCTLTELLLEEVDKESDKSDYVEDGPYTEDNPLDSGWDYAIFIGYSHDTGNNICQVDLYSRRRQLSISVPFHFAEALGDSVYVRYKKHSNGNYEVYPSMHRHTILGTMKVRPFKSLEIRPIGVVAFCRDAHSPIPVWSDAVGWRPIDFRHFGVFRRGLVDMRKDDIFKTLRLIEFTVKIRLDIEQTGTDFNPDLEKIIDIAPLCYTSDREMDIPECFYPKCPKRLNDLTFIEYTMDLEPRAMFSSKQHPQFNFWASVDQCAFSEDEKDRLSGIFVPCAAGEYRGLLVAPIQRIHQLTKGHFLNYRLFSPRRIYSHISLDIKNKVVNGNFFSRDKLTNSINWFV